MPTEKQKKAVKAMLENGGIISKAMEASGYTKATSKTPQKLTQSKGFKELCEECGLTDDLILVSLVEDIKKKPQNRKAELELGAKIKGLFTDKIKIGEDPENPFKKELDDKEIDKIIERYANRTKDTSIEKDI